MAESFYTSGIPTSPTSQFIQSPASPGGPPPPPPPKPNPHDSSRTATPQIQTQTQTQVNRPTSYQSPPPPPPHPHAYSQAPPVPPSPSHAQALAKQQHQQQHNARYQTTSPNYTDTTGQQNNTYQSNQAGNPAQQHPQSPQAPHQPQQQHQHHAPNPNSNPPTIQMESNWLPTGLSNKSTAELQPLINDTALLTAFAHQHPAYKTSIQPLQAAIEANLILAKQVASLEAQVKQLRDGTGQLLINHTSLQTQWRRKQTEMEDALSPWGPRAMYQRLVSSITEQEALLRAVHESFLEGGVDGDSYGGSGGNCGKATEKEITEWIKRIREGTTVLEKRREMRARWDEGRVGGWR